QLPAHIPRLSLDGALPILLIRDGRGRPAAVTAISLFRVDGSILAGPIIRGVAAGMRRFRPQFLRLPMLIGGVPIATGGPAIAFRDRKSTRLNSSHVKDSYA